MFRTKFGLWAAVIGVFVVAVSARADSMTPPPYYQTYGGFGIFGDPNPIAAGVAFNGTGAYLEAPGSFSLGQFQTTAISPGTSVTMQNTPFWVVVSVYPQGPISPDGPFTVNSFGILIQGNLNGQLSNTTSSLIATISSAAALTPSNSTTAGFLSELNFDTPQLIAPNVTNGGLTTLNARIEGPWALGTVPEPSTWLALGPFALWLGWKRWRRRAECP